LWSFHALFQSMTADVDSSSGTAVTLSQISGGVS
jgi:hypothetical protein